MHAKLSQEAVLRSQPAERDFDITDTSLPGFALRVRTSGAKVWTYRYRTAAGQARRYVIGRFPGIGAAAARRLALGVAADVALGTDVQVRKRALRADGEGRRGATLERFLDEQYEPWAKTHLKTAAFQISRIRADFKAWLNKPLADISGWLIESWRNRSREHGKRPVTINRDVQRIRAVLSKAVEWNVLAAHPFAGLKPLRTDKTGRVRYLTPEEENRLREALIAREQAMRDARERFNQWRRARGLEPLPPRSERQIRRLRAIVLLALNTGLRRGELLQLHWRHADLTGKWLVVEGSSAKNGQTRRIPLNAEAHATLVEWRQLQQDTSRVFPRMDGERLKRIDRAWKSLKKRARITDLRLHDLRHHFASRLVQSGVDLNTVRELLGHADITMVLRYAHMSPGRLAAAVETVARHPSERRSMA